MSYLQGTVRSCGYMEFYWTKHWVVYTTRCSESIWSTGISIVPLKSGLFSLRFSWTGNSEKLELKSLMICVWCRGVYLPNAAVRHCHWACLPIFSSVHNLLQDHLETWPNACFGFCDALTSGDVPLAWGPLVASALSLFWRRIHFANQNFDDFAGVNSPLNIGAPAVAFKALHVVINGTWSIV